MYSSASNQNAEPNQESAEKINGASRKVLNFFDYTSKEISHAKETVATHIQEKPLSSTLVALSIGLVIGALFSRL